MVAVNVYLGIHFQSHAADLGKSALIAGCFPVQLNMVALRMSPQTHPDRLLIPVLSAANFVIGMGAFVVIGLLEPLGNDLDRSPAQAGLLMTVYAVAYAFLSPVLVSLTGQIGRRRVLAGGLSLFALAAALSAIAPSFLILNITRVLAAAGAGMFTPLAAAVVANVFPEAQRARVLAAVFFGLTLSQVVGVPAGSWIAYTYGWRWAFASIAVMALPCIWLIWTHVPAGLKFQPVALSDLRKVLEQGRMIFAILFTGSYLGAIYVLYTYLAPLLSETMGFGRNEITAVLFIYGLGSVAGNIISGRVADRLGWERTLTAICIGQIILMPLYSMLPMNIALFLVITFVWSAIGWSFMAAQQLRLIGLSGTRAPVVLALNAAAIYVGAAIGSALGGLVIAGWGLEALGLAAGLTSVLTLIHLTLSSRIFPPPPGGS